MRFLKRCKRNEIQGCEKEGEEGRLLRQRTQPCEGPGVGKSLAWWRSREGGGSQRRGRREAGRSGITGYNLTSESFGFIPKERKIVVPAGGVDLAGNNGWQAAGCTHGGAL